MKTQLTITFRVQDQTQALALATALKRCTVAGVRDEANNNLTLVLNIGQAEIYSMDIKEQK